jgi:hypothetical protein
MKRRSLRLSLPRYSLQGRAGGQQPSTANLSPVVPTTKKQLVGPIVPQAGKSTRA